jgi:hypothetical protein
MMLLLEWVIEALSAVNLCQVKSPKVFFFSVWSYIDLVRARLVWPRGLLRLLPLLLCQKVQRCSCCHGP